MILLESLYCFVCVALKFIKELLDLTNSKIDRMLQVHLIKLEILFFWSGNFLILVAFSLVIGL